MLSLYLNICFESCTGPQTLRWMIKQKKNAARNARWRLQLLELDFEIVRHAGAHHQALEAVLRLSEKTHEEQLGPASGDIPTLDVQSTDKRNDTPVMLLIQGSSLMLTQVKMKGTQSQNTSFQNCGKDERHWADMNIQQGWPSLREGL